jgi:hypothetical protein
MAQATDAPRFQLRIEAPEAFRGLLQKHLNIQRFQALADLDVPELQRLVDQLPADARQLMGSRPLCCHVPPPWRPPSTPAWVRSP